MNKQPATIRTYLFRGAFLLSLLGAIVIPIALGQQDASKGNVTKPAARQNVAANTYRTGPPVTEMFSAHPQQPNISRTELSHLITPTNGATGVRSVPILLAPKFPQVVLYDQYNNGSTTASLSATFTDFSTFNADLADDFVVPGGQTWNVQSIDADGLYFNGAGPATSWNVFIYADNGGLPGAQVYSTLNQPVVVSNTTFTVSLSPAAVLTAGTYWIEIQANMTFGTQGEWGWTDRTVQSNNAAAWQNPGGGFGLCPSWTTKLVCIPTAGGPDQVYRINGTLGGPTPTPTPTPTPPQCTYNVLVVSADCGDPETTLLASLRAEPGIGTVDFFDATIATPTLAQLQQYAIVLAFSNCGYQDATTLGNNLDAYLANFGIVVALNFDWFGGAQSIGGAWITNDSPFNDNATVNFISGTLQTCTDGALCDGVTTLQSFFREITTLASGATAAGTWSDGSIMMATKGRTVGISGYFGDYADNYSGQLPRIVANAGRLFLPCPTPTPTPTPTVTPTPTATPTVTPTPTPGQIVLTAQSRRTNGGVMVRLNWSGATTAQVDIYRNGAQLARVGNTGSYIDTLTTFGTYTYKVCNKNTMNCSNEVTKRFGGQ